MLESLIKPLFPVPGMWSICSLPISILFTSSLDIHKILIFVISNRIDIHFSQFWMPGSTGLRQRLELEKREPLPQPTPHLQDWTVVLFCVCPYFLCERGKGTYFRTTIPLMRDPPFPSDHLSKSQLLGVGFQGKNLGDRHPCTQTRHRHFGGLLSAVQGMASEEMNGPEKYAQKKLKLQSVLIELGLPNSSQPIAKVNGSEAL